MLFLKKSRAVSFFVNGAKRSFRDRKKDKGSDYINENLCVWSLKILKQKTAYTRF